MADRPTKMDEDRLRAIVNHHITSAIGSTIGGGGDLEEDRRKALDYYMGKPLGNEIDGRSKIVSHDVAETVEWMLPSLLEIFTAGDDVVRFDPVGPEDEQVSDQATDFVNYIFTKENDGFQVLYDAFKDALIQKIGVFKTWWEEKEEQKREVYKGLTPEEYQKLLQDDDLEVTEVTERDEMVLEPTSGMPLPMPVMDCVAIRTVTEGRVKVEAIAPEQFLFSRRAVKLEDEKGNMVVPFTCHRVKKTLSDLVQEGFEWDEIYDIPSAFQAEYNDERNTRFQNEDAILDSTNLDAAMREVWIHECYMRIDYDGDGIAETRKIIVGGTGHKLLVNEEVPEQPFSVITPIPTPHSLVGLSVADQVMPIQELKSTIWRQLLDNIYAVNNQRAAVNERVDLDSYLNNAVGGVITIDGREPVGDSIQWQPSTSIANHVFPMLEYADQVRESRAGVSRLNQGLDPDALNDTASGMNMLMTASQRRMLLIARIFANTGVRDMFRKILRLVVQYQDKPKMIRLRNQFVPIDPSGWNAQMDVVINVGLGYGSKEQQLVARRQILDLQAQAIQMQGGISGPLIKANHVSHAFLKFIEAAGEQQPDAYVADIGADEAEQMAQQPPAPDPEMARMQAEMQMEQQKFQMDAQAKQADVQLKQQSEQAKLQMDQQKMQVDMAKVQAQMELEREQHMLRMQMMREEHALKMELQARDAQAKRAQQAADGETKRALATQQASQPKEEKTPEPKVEPINLTINTGSKKRRVNIERDGEGSILGALVEDDD